MISNIFVTGAAGFIGGSVVKDLASRQNGELQGSRIVGTLRTAEQAHALAKAGINAIQLDINDKAAVEKCIINVIVHTASPANPEHPISLIKALAQSCRNSSQEGHYIHAGITALFTEQTGWPYGHVKDSDTDMLAKEKQIGTDNPVRETDIVVIDDAKAHDVKAYNVVVPMTYGAGSGEWKKVSQNIPAQLRASLKNKLVRKFPDDARSAAVHVSDLTALYALLVKKIVSGEPLPHNEHGYYFGFAHHAPWHNTINRLAQNLYNRGLVTKPTPEVWASYEEAAEHLGWSPQFARAMATTKGDLAAVQAYEQLGWQPKWTEQMYLDSMDEEIDCALENDKFEPTLYKAMMKNS